MNIENLVGCKILNVFGNSNNISFKTDKGFINFQAEGDCCSHSWFEHFEGVDSLVGATVKNIEEISLENVGIKSEDWECIRVYGYKITTDKGYAQIEMRNSSNGYYGGYIIVSSEQSSSEPLESDF